MADASTPNYNFVLPEPGGSDDTWGDKLNANWGSADTLLKGLADADAALASKTYVDTEDAKRLLLAGGTLSGFLTLNADPTADLHASTKGYVDTQLDTRLTQAQADILYVNMGGDAMTGALTLSGDPTVPLHAATKQFVEAQQALMVKPYTLINVAGLASVEFLDIPDWASELTLMLYDLLHPTSSVTHLAQFGTAAAWVTTGYNGSALLSTAAATSVDTISTGFPLTADGAQAQGGVLTLHKMVGSNEWVAAGAVRRSTASMSHPGGRVPLAAPATRLRVFPPSGAFTSGRVSLIARR